MSNLSKFNQILCISICFLTFLCGCGDRSDTEKKVDVKQNEDTNSKMVDLDKEWGIPRDLIFNGKPIDAVFIREGLSGGNLANWKDTSIKRKESPYSDGYFGCEYIPKDAYDENFPEWMYTYSCYWKYLGTLEDGKSHIILINSSTGGSGRFSEVSILQRNGNLLHNTKTIANGDRCDGGIENAFVQGDTIFILQSTLPLQFFITCVDILSSYDKTVKYREDQDHVNHIRYKGVDIQFQWLDMPGAAVSWAVTCNLSWKNNVLEVIGCEFPDDDEEYDDYKSLLHECFDKVIERYYSLGKKKLDRDAMKNFAQEVLDLYLQKKES